MVTDSVIHAHKRLRTIRSSTHRKYQSTIQHSSNFNFLRGHHLPPIDYARPRRQQSPISTIHLANLRRPLPHLEVYVTDNIRCDVIIHTAAPSSFGGGHHYLNHYYRHLLPPTTYFKTKLHSILLVPGDGGLVT